MSENLVNHKTFDLGAVLAGQSYPEEVVDVYFDERTAYMISLLNEQVRELSVEGGEKYEEADKALKDLIASLEASKFQFHLQGIPQRIRKAILDRVEVEIPEERNGLGMAQPNSNREELFRLYMFEAYISKIVDPDGAEIVKPSLESIKELRESAPRHALEKIEQGIIDLENKTVYGFELAIKSSDFLSKP
jgi:hypothetical protein